MVTHTYRKKFQGIVNLEPTCQQGQSNKVVITISLELSFIVKECHIDIMLLIIPLELEFVWKSLYDISGNYTKIFSDAGTLAYHAVCHAIELTCKAL